MTALGTSFTRWRAEALGLDYRRAFARLCQLGFDVVRLSASWREVHNQGYQHLDWLIRHAEDAGQPVVLTVGMKALGWPEFYLPDGFNPRDVLVQRQALDHVRGVVARYQGRSNLIAWQIENEPFNRSGPQGLWIPRTVVRREANVVRDLDDSRPLAVTTFAHFDGGLDRASTRHQSKWRHRLGLAIPAEREALTILRRSDILGVDVYRSIIWADDSGTERLSRARPDQLEWVRRWQRIATSQGKRFWVTEAQAEPWEPRRASQVDPITIQPRDVGSLVAALTGIGIETILLWGSEYWLWREQEGDGRWIDGLALGRGALV